MRRKGSLWLLMVLALLVGGAERVAPAGQATRRNQASPGSQNPFADFGDPDSPADKVRRLRALNVERHKTMVSDTAKLLQLARQLDEEIAGNKSDALTTEELRKVAAIEKLAHNVRYKMALSYDNGPEIREQIPTRGPQGGSPLGGSPLGP